MRVDLYLGQRLDEARIAGLEVENRELRNGVYWQSFADVGDIGEPFPVGAEDRAAVGISSIGQLLGNGLIFTFASTRQRSVLRFRSGVFVRLLTKTM